MDELIKYFQFSSGISKPLLDILLPKFSSSHLKAGKFLIRKGQFESKYYFVETGSIRKYFIHKEKEYIVWIQTAGDLFCEIKSLRTSQPTNYYFQAIEPTTYWSINAKEFIDQNKPIFSKKQIEDAIRETQLCLPSDTIIGGYSLKIN